MAIVLTLSRWNTISLRERLRTLSHSTLTQKQNFQSIVFVYFTYLVDKKQIFIYSAEKETYS